MSSKPVPQMFIPRKEKLSVQEDISLDHRINALHIQNSYNNHTHTGIGQRPATRVVAASNSLDTTAADYVCAGDSTDATTLQSAINDCAARPNGGKVLLLDGTFNIPAGAAGNVTVALKTGVSIEGMGAGTVLKTVNSAGGTCRVIGTNTADAAVGISIKNLTIDGNRANNGTQQQVGVDLQSATNAVVDSVLVKNCYATGYLVIGPSERIAVSNCLATNNGNLAGAGSPHQWWFEGNRIAVTNCHGYSSVGKDFYISQGQETQLVNCTSHLAGTDSFMMNTPSLSRFTGCISDSPGGIGFVLNSCNFCEMDDCTSNLAAQEGIFVGAGSNDVLVVDNTVQSASTSAHNTYSAIITYALRSTIKDNFVRKAAGAPQQQYGLNINAAAVGTLAINNDLYLGGATAAYFNAGAGTLANLDGSVNNWNRLL